MLSTIFVCSVMIGVSVLLLLAARTPTQPETHDEEIPVRDATLSQCAAGAVTALFELRDVSKSYRDANGRSVQVLRNVNLTIMDRAITGLLGPSGQGKSTTLNLLGGLDSPDSGEICFRGSPLVTLDEEALRHYRAECISFIFQDLNLVTHLNVLENAALPLLLRGAPWKEAVERARVFVDAVDLAHLGHRRPNALSGGERQRVAIARAFTNDTEVILADEPTGSLDPDTAGRVMDLFCELAHERRRPIVLVSHNHDLLRRYCDRIVYCTPDGLRDMTVRAA